MIGTFAIVVIILMGVPLGLLAARKFEASFFSSLVIILGCWALAMGYLMKDDLLSGLIWAINAIIWVGTSVNLRSIADIKKGRRPW